MSQLNVNDSHPLCWICSNTADSREHRTKRADLRAQFGDNISQSNPLYFHNNKGKNQKVGGLGANPLKFPPSICSTCNSARTQPYDFSWDKFREDFGLNIQNKIQQRRFWVKHTKQNSTMRANRIFPYDTARQMLKVHLYFVKILGCHIVENKIPIDLKSLATALLKGKAHPNIYLKFGIAPLFGGEPWVGASNALIEIDQTTGEVQFLTWFYYIGNFAVNVMYAVEGQKRDGLIGAWHPKLGTNRLEIANFRDMLPDSQG